MFPKVFISSFHTSLLSAHVALQPNYRLLRKQNHVFHDITSTLDILHKQVVQRPGFYSGLSWPSLHSEIYQALPFQKGTAGNKQISSLVYEKCKKHYYVVSRENRSISLVHFFASAKSRLLGFCGCKLGQRERLNRCVIMNNDLYSSKLADINLHQQKLVKMCLLKHTQ